VRKNSMKLRFSGKISCPFDENQYQLIDVLIVLDVKGNTHNEINLME